MIFVYLIKSLAWDTSYNLFLKIKKVVLYVFMIIFVLKGMDYRIRGIHNINLYSLVLFL